MIIDHRLLTHYSKYSISHLISDILDIGLDERAINNFYYVIVFDLFEVYKELKM